MKNVNKSQIKTVHKNISCNECKKNPIVGVRYKCLECFDYNLCDECEKIINHEHNFLKYVTEENSLNKYSYKCLTSKMSISIYEGEEQAELNIFLKNNGYSKWRSKKWCI